MNIRSRIIVLFICSAFLSVFVFFLLLKPLNTLYTAVIEEETFSPYELETVVRNIKSKALSISKEKRPSSILQNAAAAARKEHPGIPGVIIQIISGSGEVIDTIGVQDTIEGVHKAGIHTDRYSLEEMAVMASRSGQDRTTTAEIFTASLKPSDTGGLVVGIVTEERTPGLQMTVSKHGTSILLILFLGAVGSVIVVTIFITFLGTRSLLRRFSSLNKGLRMVMDGDLTYRLNDRAKDELGFISRSFDTMLENLSEQKNLREQMEEERNRLLAGLSHDLRTPLSSILGYAESIRDNPEDDPAEIRTQAEIIRDKSEYMENLLKDLLDYSSSTSPTPAAHTSREKGEINIFELLRTTVISFLPSIRAKRIDLDVQIPEEVKIVEGEKKGLTRVLENILKNAVSYCNEEGNIAVCAEPLEEESYSGQKGVRISVSNTGDPVKTENRRRIFDTFYRGDKSRHGKGLGLGLSIAKTIVTQHDGRIYLEPDSSHTTTMIIELPIKGG